MGPKEENGCTVNYDSALLICRHMHFSANSIPCAERSPIFVRFGLVADIISKTLYCTKCIFYIFYDRLKLLSKYNYPAMLILYMYIQFSYNNNSSSYSVIACIYCRQLSNKTTCRETHGSYSYQQYRGRPIAKSA